MGILTDDKTGVDVHVEFLVVRQSMSIEIGRGEIDAIRIDGDIAENHVDFRVNIFILKIRFVDGELRQSIGGESINRIGRDFNETD